MNLGFACAGPSLAVVLAALGAPPYAPPVPHAPLSEVVQDHESEWLELVEAFEEAQQEFYAAFDERWSDFDYDKASAEQRAELQEWWSAHQPDPKFLPRFEALAAKAKGSDVAVKAWGKVLDIAPQSGDQDALARALDALLPCVESPAMAEIAEQLRHVWGAPPEKVLALLEALRGKSPHRKVQAAATFSLGALLMQSESHETKARARKLLVELGEKFADVSSGRRARTYAKLAEGLLFELDHLQIGMLAPDMEALDVEGVKFKLSDYRGKVTVLDFWGFW